MHTIVDKPKRSPKKSGPSRGEIVDAARTKKAAQDPLSMLTLRSLGLRVGIPLVLAWVIAFFIHGWIPKVVALVLTLVVGGIVVWALRYAKRSKAVAEIVKAADTPEARKEALEKLETDFKKGDTAAVFARAQLQMQEDPRAAQKTLETINLDKVMAPMADEARAQRAMIHLMYGETDEARTLVDKIDISRHKEHKSRATIAAVIGEAWARTGQAKKAVELLETIDTKDDTYAELRPQLLRARAFAYAWSNDTKQMKATLRRLGAINSQFLMGFVTKRKNPGGVPSRGVHPVLEKEAYEMVMRSGSIPRRMEMRRG
jgi:hypothetical protein